MAQTTPPSGSTSQSHDATKIKSYRERKEEFVSNLEGTTLLETTVMTLILPISTIFQNVLCSYIFGDDDKTSTIARFFVEFAARVMPIIMIETLFADYMGWFMIVLAIATFVLYRMVQQKRRKDRKSSVTNSEFESSMGSQRKLFLSEYRTGIMLSTCIAILAVDFHIFPRRFAKTETYGTSLMDLGVGCFVFSNALVSGPARASARPAADQQKGSTGSMASNFMRALRSVSVLLIIGIIRMISTKGADYQAHVSEYGIHWNFFFTLAVVALFASLFPNASWQVGAAIIIVYEFALLKLGLKDYILHHPRENFISANKEGICSSIGYLAIYFFGVAVGKLIWRCKERKEWKLLIPKLWIADAALWAFALFAHAYIHQSSRRMVNIAYAAWIVAHSLFLLAIFITIELYAAPLMSKSIVRDAVNRNQLFTFLIANLLTGLINLTIPTLDITAIPSLAINTAYMLVVCGIATYLHSRGINLKFW
eukprot:GEZU01021916.1.p1 GENE.GEZU01021916.1~~GEZU01021916.1.p1  ORF type:complete len:482 (-),score=98.40 GEZU01021916.1:350-1795(-)